MTDLKAARRSVTALGVAGHLVVLVLLACIIAAVVIVPGEAVLVGPRFGAKTPVPKLYVQMAVLAVVLPLAVVALMRVVVGGYAVWHSRPASAERVHLAPGEPILWSGRPGWRSFRPIRLLGATTFGMIPVLFVWWLWSIWTDDSPATAKVLWTFFATIVLGGSASGVVVMGLPILRTWLHDIAGTLVVTDRRIAWRTALDRSIYRELAIADLVHVAFVEGNERRGWITVTEDRKGRVKEIDLQGLPDPLGAVAALERQIARAKW